MAVHPHIIRRVRHHHVGAFIAHERGVGLRGERIPANETVFSKLPEIAGSGDGRHLLVWRDQFIVWVRL